MALGTLHVDLSPEAVRCLERATRYRNRAGRTLRDWLVRSFDLSHVARSSQNSLFGTTIAVDGDVPVLLEALSRLSNRPVDELVEDWAHEQGSPKVEAGGEAPASSLPEDARDKAAELVDLAETLLEESISDARRRLGSYPEGDEALKAAADVFAALRRVLGVALAQGELLK